MALNHLMVQGATMPAHKKEQISILLCPVCKYPLAPKEQRLLCSECGGVWSEQEVKLRLRAKKAFLCATATVSLQLLLIGVPLIFDRRSLGLPAGMLGFTLVLIGILGTPIWSIPAAWWSHLNWRATTMQGAPIKRSIVISDVITRWILVTIVLSVFCIITAIIFSVFMETVGDNTF